MQRDTTHIKASILGASGYSGAMLFKLLLQHTNVSVEHVFADTSIGSKVTDLYPQMRSLTDKKYEQYSIEKVEASDVVFIALPAGHAMQLVPELLQANKKIIDLSGDFRLHDIEQYQQYYQINHTASEFLSVACYGLPEINGASISTSKFISSPGCYATSAIIPLASIVKNSLIEENDIFISSLSGVSGAGRKGTVDYSFTEIDGSVKAYKVGKHQHIPEIQTILSDYSGKTVEVNFVPHLIPISRGIYTTIFASLKEHVSGATIDESFQNAFVHKPFVRYLQNEIPSLKSVVDTNFIDIGWKLDERTGKLIVFSTLDNLLKGAAGQAIQSMNIMYGFDEHEGLI